MVVGVGVWDRGEFSIGLKQRLTESKLDLKSGRSASPFHPLPGWESVPTELKDTFLCDVFLRKEWVLFFASCLPLCDPIDWTRPGSSVHGDSPGKNTGVGCHALLQGVFPMQGSNLGLPHGGRILYHLSTREACTLLYDCTVVWLPFLCPCIPLFP